VVFLVQAETKPTFFSLTISPVMAAYFAVSFFFILPFLVSPLWSLPGDFFSQYLVHEGTKYLGNLYAFTLISWFLLYVLGPVVQRAKKDYEDRGEKMKSLFAVVPLGALITSLYFGYKGLPWVWGGQISLKPIEGDLWEKFLVPAIQTTPDFIYQFFIVCYSYIWYGTFTFFFAVFVVCRTETAKTFYLANFWVMLSFALINFAIPTLDPVRDFPGIIQPVLNKMHYPGSLHGLYDTASATIRSWGVDAFGQLARTKQPYFPIAGLPSYHVAYVTLLALLGQDNLPASCAWLRRALWGFVAITWAGSVWLGYHFVVDGLIGLLATWGIYRWVQREIRKRQ